MSADLRAHLAEVEALISEHELRGQKLEETRSAILSQLDGIVYPVLTLPDEITSQIFLHCLSEPIVSHDWTFDDEPPILATNARHAPLLLLHICRAWKCVAISTPRLWVDLRLDFDFVPVNTDPEVMVEFVDAWFSRAGSCPLALNISGSDTGMGMEVLTSTVVSAALQRHAPRLQRLILNLQKDDFGAIQDIGPFPLLEELTLGLPFFDDLDPSPMKLPGITTSATRLHELTLIEDLTPSLVAEFPWGQLTKFSCEGLTEEEFFRLLHDAESLVECTCSVDDGEDGGAFQAEVAPGPHLRLQTLRLFEDSSTDVLQSLQLPALKNLHIFDVDISMDDQNLLPFLTRSSASLETFSFGGADADCVKWLSVTSRLTHLELDNPNPSFFRGFLPLLDRTSTGGKEFLPHLQSLSFLDCDRDITTPLLQALSSRSTAEAGMARLQSFRQIWSAGKEVSFQGPVISALRALMASGMEIHLGPLSKSRI
ncbi:hypothetical protein C8R44DRAFT_76300 [Mycena epipterygia]|nr:hypothetical protein C8R44DRAFT_76300 [Mycena epipterygia]